MRSGVCSSLSFFHTLAQLSLAADPSGHHQHLQYYASRAGIAFTILNGSTMTVNSLLLYESHTAQASRVVHLRVNVTRSGMVSRPTKIGTWNPSSQLPALRAWIIFAMMEVDRPTPLNSQVEAMCYALRSMMKNTKSLPDCGRTTRMTKQPRSSKWYSVNAFGREKSQTIIQALAILVLRSNCCKHEACIRMVTQNLSNKSKTQVMLSTKLGSHLQG